MSRRSLLLLLLLGAAPVHAQGANAIVSPMSPPTATPRAHRDFEPDSLSEEEHRARRALAFRGQVVGGLATTGSVLIGLGMVFDETNDHVGMGTTLVVGGLLVGPSLGWVSTGHGQEAGRGFLRRTAEVGVLSGVGIMTGMYIGDWAGVGVALGGILLGATLATFDGIADLDHLGRHVMARGAGGRPEVGVLTPVGPGLALSVPLP